VIRTSLWCTIVAIALIVGGHAQGAEPKLSGDLRGGFVASEREARDGRRSDAEAWRARLRLAFDLPLAPQWRLRARLAGRFGTDQDGMHWYLRSGTPAVSGAAPGDVTLDELHVEHAAAGGGWTLRGGRFQSKFELDGIAAKSLDRNDSPNMDVTWTDGVHLRHGGLPGWWLHAVVQRNADGGTGAALHPPLDFSAAGSRHSAFLGLEARAPAGPVVQRMLSLSWLPAALPEAAAGSARHDYLAVTARGALAWPIGQRGTRLRLGGEAGYAPQTPSRARLGLPGGGDSGGMAWQLALSFEELRPGHGIALVAGHADPGWLLSPDFRPNDRLAEVRYQWRFARQWSFEARLREREERERPAGTLQPRRDRDGYLRLTGKF
jgi:hypothetical protein